MANSGVASLTISKTVDVNTSPLIASNMYGEIKNHPHLRECFGE